MDKNDQSFIIGKLSSLNVNAPAFVPSFMKHTSAVPVADAVEPHQNQHDAMAPSLDEESDFTAMCTDATRNTWTDDANSTDSDAHVNDWEEADVETEKQAIFRNQSAVNEVHDDGETLELNAQVEDDFKADGVQVSDVTKSPTSTAKENKMNKEHVNLVFIGHVDAGKSTIGGQILHLTGMVDKRTLEKYEKEAKEKNRESWYLSWALDTNSEERDKGKTVEVGRATFETERKRFTILDAPGHKSFVPNMIVAAAQADLAVLVVSARKGEFETGFERGGQTSEHATLVKAAGVQHLVVLVNKMDDPTVDWDEDRYNECKGKLLPFLMRKQGFKDVTFIPCSGLTGAGLKEPVDGAVCPWYSGKHFIKFIDEMPSVPRMLDRPFLMPIVDRYKDMGTVVFGKIEAGQVRKGQTLVVMPNKATVVVDHLCLSDDADDNEVTVAGAGENVKIKLKGVEEEDISPGFVLCHPRGMCKTGRVFHAQIAILEHKSIICAGYSAVCHLHTLAEEVSIKELACLVDKKTNKTTKGPRPRFLKQDQTAIVKLEAAGVICVEPFDEFPKMARFTLRDEGKTVGFGKVLKVIE